MALSLSNGPGTDDVRFPCSLAQFLFTVSLSALQQWCPHSASRSPLISSARAHASLVCRCGSSVPLGAALGLIPRPSSRAPPRPTSHRLLPLPSGWSRRDSGADTTWCSAQIPQISYSCALLPGLSVVLLLPACNRLLETSLQTRIAEVPEFP